MLIDEGANYTLTLDEQRRAEARARMVKLKLEPILYKGKDS